MRGFVAHVRASRRGDESRRRWLTGLRGLLGIALRGLKEFSCKVRASVRGGPRSRYLPELKVPVAMWLSGWDFSPTQAPERKRQRAITKRRPRRRQGVQRRGRQIVATIDVPRRRLPSCFDSGRRCIATRRSEDELFNAFDRLWPVFGPVTRRRIRCRRYLPTKKS